MIDYLRLQVEAGAQAVQIFDSWAGLLGAARTTSAFALRLRSGGSSSGVRDRGVPVIYFVNGAPHLIEAAADRGPDVLGLCWRTPLDEAAARASAPRSRCRAISIRTCLFAEPADVAARAPTTCWTRMAGRPGHIMNLGHGILPDTPIASVEALVAAVHDVDARHAAGTRDAGTHVVDARAARALRPARARATPRTRPRSSSTRASDDAVYVRASRAARSRRRRAALALRAPAVLRGALRLLRLQRGDHAAPRRGRAATSTTWSARSICWPRTCRDRRVGRRRCTGAAARRPTTRPEQLSAPARADRPALHVHAGRRDRRRDRSARHHARAARHAARARLQPPVDGRAGLRARGPGSRQPHPELRADARR